MYEDHWFDIWYNVFVCPVDVIMHEDDQCVLYLLWSVCMSCVCNKMYEDDQCLLYL